LRESEDGRKNGSKTLRAARIRREDDGRDGAQIEEGVIGIAFVDRKAIYTLRGLEVVRL
jgi:hypothetical protein